MLSLQSGGAVAGVQRTPEKLQPVAVLTGMVRAWGPCSPSWLLCPEVRPLSAHAPALSLHFLLARDPGLVPPGCVFLRAHLQSAQWQRILGAQ